MRVLHAPIYIGGQASILVLALKELGINADLLIFDQKYAMRYCDINLRLSEKTILTKDFVLLSNFIKCFFRYDIFHFHFGQSLLPVNLDLPILKLFGKKVIMEYWGSDIRQADIAINYVYLKKNELQKIYPGKEDKYKRKKIKRIEEFVNLTIVGDYQILPYSPKSIVVRQALDLSEIPYIGCENRNEKIKIIHAPTDREKKGTKYVLDAIERLRKENYNIDFILIEKQTHEALIEMCKNADIIIDALLLESFGIFSMEGMALGKPVLNRIDEKFVKYYPGLPILRTDPDNIYDNLKLLIENPDLRKELGKKGRKYVEEIHDSKKIARQLIELYRRI
jgi:glycosyltransferase involved in cell wall biosynthesis